MRVLWLVNFMLPEFAKAMGRRVINQGGWLPALVCAMRKYAPQIELIIACEDRSARCIDVEGVKYIALHCGRGREREKAVRVLVNKINPDIVHIHGSEGRWASLRREAFGVAPAVLSVQGVVSGCYPHYSGNLMPSETFSVANIPNILLTRYWISRAAKVWRTRLAREEQKAFRSFDAFLGRTEWDEAWVKYFNPQSIYFHVGEVLREPFYFGGRSDASVVSRTIYCGAAFNYPLKGGHWLLRAVASLSRKYPNIELRVANALKVDRPKGVLSFIRQGEYHRYLASLIRELGIEKNVVLLPDLSADEVVVELTRAELFCLPSLCENSSNSLGEAMLMGCPCIAADVGGMQTLLKNGELGVLVPSADPAILAYEIEKLFEDKGLAARYAAAGHQDAISRYSPDRVVRELLAAYKHMVCK